MFALGQLRKLGPRASELAARVVALARESAWAWERAAALRCLPAIVADDQRRSVGEALVEHDDAAAWLRDEFAVVADMVMSGWAP